MSFQRRSKPVIKVSRVESIGASRKKYENFWMMDGRKKVSSGAISSYN